MRTLVIALGLAVAASASAAPFDKSGIADWTKAPAPTAEPAFTPPVAKRLKLANGMALLVIENHKLPIIAVNLVVPGAGGSADPAKQGGTAAFTADLLDEGAGGLSPIAIAEESDRLGASIRTGVTADAAYVTIETLTKTLDATLDLATKVITQPTFDPKELERVKGDRAQSLDLRSDRPREVASIVLNGALYGATSAYGHPTAGVRDEFKSIGLAEVQTFYKEHWNPAAMTLVVAGDVDATALKTKLDASLGAWKPAGVKPPAAPIATPAKLTSRLLLVDRPDAAQSDVRIGLVGPDRKDSRYFEFEVLRTTLGDGFTSRLVQRLREQLGITYGARAGMDWRQVPGPFSIGTAIVTPSTAQGITETIAILDDLTTNDVKPEELEKSKQNLIRALPAQFGTNAETAAAFGELALLGLRDDYYSRYAAGIRKVTARDVHAVAKSMIPSKKMVVTIVGDLAKIGPGLEKLALGTPAMFDSFGTALAAPAAERFGYFSITATAKTSIYIDGRKVGETPFVRLPVTPGLHKVKAVSTTGKTKELSITIVGGKDLDQGAITW